MTTAEPGGVAAGGAGGDRPGRPDGPGPARPADTLPIAFPPSDTSQACLLGTVTVWYVEEGEPVVPGRVVAEVEVAGEEIEVLAPAAGVLRRLVDVDGAAAQGETVAYVEVPVDDGDD